MDGMHADERRDFRNLGSKLSKTNPVSNQSHFHRPGSASIPSIRRNNFVSSSSMSAALPLRLGIFKSRCPGSESVSLWKSWRIFLTWRFKSHIRFCFPCSLLFQISPLRMRRTKMDFYRRSLRTQSPHGLSGSVNREEAHPKSLFLSSLLFPFASFASFCSKSLPSRC